MNDKLQLNFSHVKNISECNITLPLGKGMYALVGENGCGKSTIMAMMALCITDGKTFLQSNDFNDNTIVCINANGKADEYYFTSSKLSLKLFPQRVKLYGFYEGSVFHGSRFRDHNKVHRLLKRPDYYNYITEADPFVTENLGFVLKGNKNYYSKLKKLNSKTVYTSEGNIKFSGMPYFLGDSTHIISQYNMSSGESMLISIIDCIYNKVLRDHEYSKDKKYLFLFDEIELALHSKAIERLINFLNGKKILHDPEKRLQNSNITFYFSTHSADIIDRIISHNIFLIEREDCGIISHTNNVYSQKANRRIGSNSGCDFLFFVEDEMARHLVEMIIKKHNLYDSKLWHVIAIGGADMVAKIHWNFENSNIFNDNTRIISIYDGDKEDEIRNNPTYIDIEKAYLPILSVEKYLKDKIIDNPDKRFIELLDSKYFVHMPILESLSKSKYNPNVDSDGKILLNTYLVYFLGKRNIHKDSFIKELSVDIFEYEDFTKFTNRLKRILSPESISQTKTPVSESEKLLCKKSMQTVSAGTGMIVGDADYAYIYVSKNDLTKNMAYCIQVSGDSMYPLYSNGDILIVVDDFVNNGDIGIFNVDGSGFVKKNSEKELISLNKDYDPIMKKNKNIVPQGLVAGVLEADWILGDYVNET